MSDDEVVEDKAVELIFTSSEQFAACEINNKLHEMIERAEKLPLTPCKTGSEAWYITTTLRDEIPVVAEAYYKSITDWLTKITKKAPKTDEVNMWLQEAPRERIVALVRLRVATVLLRINKMLSSSDTAESSARGSTEPRRVESTWTVSPPDNGSAPIHSDQGTTEANAVPQVVVPEQDSLQDFRNRTRLPPLPTPTLPVFDGSRLEFSSWWELFNEMIHTRPDISSLEKMSYLRECVRGTAKVALGQLSSSGSSYEDAVKLLRESFGAKKADERMALLKLESISAANDSWNSQLTLVLALKGAVANLNKTQPTLQRDLIMQQMLLKKFPSSTRTRLLEFIYEVEDVTVSAILNQAESMIKKELFIMEMSNEQSTRPNRHTIHVAKTDTPVERYRMGADRIIPTPQPLVARDEKCCVFCNKHKLSWECRKIPMVKDRIEFARKHGWCQMCLKPGGSAHQCDVRCPYCDGPHDIALCFRLMMRSSKKGNAAVKVSERNTSATLSSQGNIARRAPQQHIGQVHSILPECIPSYEPRLQTGKIRVGNRIHKRVEFILDSGASVSLISESVAKELELRELRKSECSLAGLGANSTGTRMYSIYEVPLHGINGEKLVIEAMAHPERLTATLEYSSLPAQDIAFIQKRKIRLADRYDVKSEINPVLLLGNKDYLKIVKWKKQPITLPSGFVLVPSRLGWIATGEATYGYTGSDERYLITHVSVRKQQDRETIKALERFLAVDKVVSDSPEGQVQSENDGSIVDKYFAQNVSIEGNRIHARYCLRESKLEQLSENYTSSAARLRNVVSSLRARGMLEHYHGIIMNHLEKGQVETFESAAALHSYPPHHPVYRLDKPSKPIRIVFDASAKEREKLSLNECMYTGEIRLERIPALLIRARCSQSIVWADVEAAFLQIAIKEDQRHLLRFIWLKDPNKPVRDSNLIHYRFTTAPFGVAQSPYLLEASLRMHFGNELALVSNKELDKRLVLNQLENNLYVDNILFECDEEVDKNVLYCTAKQIFRKVSMNLREFSSNSAEFVQSLPESDRGKIGLQKMLGVLWSSVEDNFILKASIPEVQGKLSKRKVLRKLASPFDPLGLLTVLLLPAKLFVQQLWTKEYGWDTDLSEEHESEWRKIEEDILAFELSIPRRVEFAANDWTLVAFADASARAMGAVVYAAGRNGGMMLMARSQLAPIKNAMTIPRLELKALLLACQLTLFTVQSIRKTRQIEHITSYIFTDSTIALYWAADRIKGPNNRAVQNLGRKIREIRQEICQVSHYACGKSPDCTELGHVRSEENPADFATRGCSSLKLSSPDHIWWKGPSWLKLNELQSRPKWNPDEIEIEMRCESQVHAAANPVLPVQVTRFLKPLIEVGRFSTYNRLCNTVAYVKRFLRIRFMSSISKGSARIKNVMGSGPFKGPLTAREIENAARSVTKMHQQAHIELIKSPGNRKLALFVDGNGIYRCACLRLENSPLSYNGKHPMFIPGNKDDPLIRLIIMHTHIVARHAGQNHTLDLLRSTFWIARARRAVQHTLRTCVICRKTIAHPFQYPAAPNLPQPRVTPARPFQAIGVDFAGPFVVRENEKPIKAYVLLFTCLTTRAVHLEVTISLSAYSFLAAFKRFVARRGVPESVLSDCAPSFKKAQSLFGGNAEEVDDLFSSYCAPKGITWHFTAPHAPWQGGIYERLIGIMKNSMARSLGRRVLSHEDFVTEVTEIEAIMNSRPLTRLSDDPKDACRVLRPADFLTPGTALAIFPKILTEEEYEPPENQEDGLVKQLSAAHARLQRCWQLFTSTYVGSLANIQQSSVRQHRSTARAPKKGEAVLIKEEKTPRGSWPIGRIVDCSERAATVRSSSGRLISRPYNLLIPLELKAADEAKEPRQSFGNYSSTEPDCVPEVGVPDSNTEVAEPSIEQGSNRPQRGCISLAKNPDFWVSMR